MRSSLRVRTRTRSFAAATTVLLALAVTPAAGAQTAEEGKQTFEQLCAACHTIGGGDGIGPDLAGLAERRERQWAEQFILDPAGVIASGDPIATQLLEQFGAPMPALGVSEAQLASLMLYLGYTAAAPEPGAPAPAPAPEPAPAPAPAPGAGNADQGKRLFQGFEDFDAGGPSCMTCHTIAGVGALGGGQLGPDLTGAWEKYGGEQGVLAALESIPFPTMAPIYLEQPLAADERADLAAFLAVAPQQQRPAGAAGKLVGFAFAGVAGLVLLGGIVWRRRLHGVRRALVHTSRGK